MAYSSRNILNKKTKVVEIYIAFYILLKKVQMLVYAQTIWEDKYESGNNNNLWRGELSS